MLCFNTCFAHAAVMDQWISQIEQWVRQQPVEQIYVAVAVMALTVVLFVLCKIVLPTVLYYLFIWLILNCLEYWRMAFSVEFILIIEFLGEIKVTRS